MYRFIRIAQPRNADHVPAALQFSTELTAHMNRTYSLSMKAGIEMFGDGHLHWHYEADSIHQVTEINRRLMMDRAYLALLEKNTNLWVEGSMKDKVVSLFFPEERRYGIRL
ncbi:MAG: hypothetical protein EBV28_06885 [Betaproteobacteria bacterium]|nr:hypothetical protein [Betaproteobacteria bacterium]